MKTYIRCLQGVVIALGIGLTLANKAGAASFTLTFDDLPFLGATDSSQGFEYANGSSTLQGVTFEPNAFRVTGDEYRIAAAPNSPFGIPYSGHFFLNNAERLDANAIQTNDNVLLTTSWVLTEAWFGQNEYYGYGGGATSVTVTALGAGNATLGLPVTLELPDDHPSTGNLPGTSVGNGLPEPLIRMDTSSFLGLVGITGYRISRVATGDFRGNWVGDDFTFTTPVAAVPEPSMSLGVLALGLLGLGSACWRKKVE